MTILYKLHHYFHGVPWIRKILSLMGYVLILENWLGYLFRKFSCEEGEVVQLRTRKSSVIEIELPRDQIAFGTVFLQGDYAWEAIIKSKFQNVLDIGGNIGLFSVWLNELHPGANYFLIEPNKANFSKCKRNLTKNNMSYRAECVGIAGMSGDRVLLAENTEGATATFMNEIGESFPEKETVQCYSFKDIVDHFSLNKIDLLKIDAEGIEYEFFESLSQSDWNILYMIVMEYHDLDSKRTGLYLKKLLSQQGFSVSIKQGKKLGSMIAHRLN
ncbi:MAG: FkbM family methyltransferase [Verrucomicrobiota bacterium]